MDLQTLKKNFGIGLTGGIATGKSAVAKMLRELGYLVIDADQLARDAVQPGSTAFQEIIKYFGPGILQPDGTLNRRAMRDRIFSSPTDRAYLESIVHPAIQQLMEKQLEQSGLLLHPKIWFYEAALLLETGSFRDFKEIWLTTCDAATQVRRVMARDKVSATEAQKAIASQMPPEHKAALATWVINTDQDLKQIKVAIRGKLQAPLPRINNP